MPDDATATTAGAVTINALPPKEALAYWQDKAAVTPDEFAALSGKAKARAFTVSGLARVDQISAVQRALREALDSGGTFRDFQQQLTAKDITLPRWRLQTIYRTNMQTAYAAGRYAQMQRTTKLRPFWRYVAVADARTRPDHIALHGMVYPHDHEFWNSYYPPNGFACRCTVQSLSQRQVDQRGLTVSKQFPDLVEPVDPVTGHTLPPRRPVPDAGFSGNVGKDWLAGLSPTAFAEEFSALASHPITPDNHALPSITRAPHIPVIKQADILKAGLSPDVYVRAFLDEFGVGIGESILYRIPPGIPVAVSDGFFRDKATGAWKTTAWRDKGPYMRLLARTIKDPYEVWQVPVMLPSGPAHSIRCIAPFSLDGGKTVGGYSAWHLIDGRGWQAATSFAPKSGRSQKAILEYIESLRVGTLLYRSS